MFNGYVPLSWRDLEFHHQETTQRRLSEGIVLEPTWDHKTQVMASSY